jgi:hypothetical protein
LEPALARAIDTGLVYRGGMTEKISSFEPNPFGWRKVFRLEDGLEYFGAVIGTFLAIF